MINYYTVTWAINVEAETPQQAAEEVWYNVFGRNTPAPDDACAFAVIESDGTTHTIDLAEEG